MVYSNSYNYLSNYVSSVYKVLHINPKLNSFRLPSAGFLERFCVAYCLSVLYWQYCNRKKRPFSGETKGQL